MPGVAPLALGALGVGSGVYGNMQAQKKNEAQQQQQSNLLAQYVSPRNMSAQAFGPYTGNQQQDLMTLGSKMSGAGNPAIASKILDYQVQNLLGPRDKPKYGLSAQPGVNPNTNQPGQFILRDDGSQIWLGSAPIETANANPKDAGFKQWRLANPNGNPAEFEQWWNIRTSAAPRETFSNPVVEIDPATGKPINVQYGNNGTRRVVQNSVPDKKNDSFGRVDYWRGVVKPELNAATGAFSQSGKIRNSLKLNSGAGDIAALNALQKLIDDGGVVKDEDINRLSSAQSLFGSLKGRMAELEKGDKLSPAMRVQIQKTSDALTNAIYAGVQQRISPYRSTMENEGVNFTDIVPSEIQKAYNWGEQSNVDMSDPSYDFAQFIFEVGKTVDLGNGNSITRTK
jgi:hypothetical protein